MREEGSSCGSWFQGFQSTLAEKACWQEDLNGLKHEEAASVGQPGGRNHARDKIPRGPTSQCSTSTRLVLHPLVLQPPKCYYWPGTKCLNTSAYRGHFRLETQQQKIIDEQRHQ